MKTIRVFFDFTCPYCYLAWGYFKKMKESAVLDDDWVGWEIHPEVPQAGRPIQKVLNGVDMEARRLKLNTLGLPVGLAPGEKNFVPNTHSALCAAEFARAAGKLHAWIDAVYRASFVEKKNIGELEVLLEIARQVGLSAEALQSALEEGKYARVLGAHDRECAERKVEWVPTVYMGEKKIIEGAFTFGEFEQAINTQVLERSS